MNTQIMKNFTHNLITLVINLVSLSTIYFLFGYGSWMFTVIAMTIIFGNALHSLLAYYKQKRTGAENRVYIFVTVLSVVSILSVLLQTFLLVFIPIKILVSFIFGSFISLTACNFFVMLSDADDMEDEFYGRKEEAGTEDRLELIEREKLYDERDFI